MWLAGDGYAGCSTASDPVTETCCTPSGGLYAYYVNGTTNGCAATDTTTNLTLVGFNSTAFQSCASGLGYLSICTLSLLQGGAPRIAAKTALAMAGFIATGLLAVL